MPKDNSQASYAANNSARHLSCEGCRKRKMKCSRTAPCVACVLRGQECVWEGCRPTQGVTQASLEDNERETIRLRKVIAQLQALLIERDGRPYYPPVAPPTPPSHLDALPPHTRLPSFSSPPLDGDFGYEYPAASYFAPELHDYPHSYPPPATAPVGSSSWSATAAGRAPGAPRSYGFSSLTRVDPLSGDYLVGSPTSGGPYSSSARYSSFPYPPPPHYRHSTGPLPSTAPAPPSANEPSIPPFLGPHSRAVTWSGPIPPSFHSSPAPLPPVPLTEHSTHNTPTPISSPHGSSAHGMSSALAGTPVPAALAPDGTDMGGAQMHSDLPKLDTSVSLHLPATVSALLNLDTTRNFGGAAGEGGEVVAVDFGEADLAAALEVEEKERTQEDDWSEMVVLPDETA
ncbi:hypothetical protein JCM10213_008483 [Rhodosporidiobolus nylandii]